MARWFLYILRCGDNSLYTGITTDVKRRLAEHRGKAGRGARYLRGRGPLVLVYTKKAGTRSQALKMEFKVKKMKKNDKERLIRHQETFLTKTTSMFQPFSSITGVPGTYFPSTRSRRLAG
jgi:putative endonuclease